MVRRRMRPSWSSTRRIASAMGIPVSSSSGTIQMGPMVTDGGRASWIDTMTTTTTTTCAMLAPDMRGVVAMPVLPTPAPRRLVTVEDRTAGRAKAGASTPRTLTACGR